MAEENQVISCHTVEDWTEQFEKGKESKKLVVVDFMASRCGACRSIALVLAEFAKKTPTVIFLKVDVEELKTVFEEWALEELPAFLFLKEGKLVDKVVGAKKEEVQLTIAKHAGTVVA
ncbi:thioredoxin H-type-like [Fagus crenata]